VKPFIRTTKPKFSEKFLFLATPHDVELLTMAAMHQEVSRADFIRQSIREKAARVLKRSGDNTEATVKREAVG
jgi:uncharacterized protein (DUF1778 family)